MFGYFSRKPVKSVDFHSYVKNLERDSGLLFAAEYEVDLITLLGSHTYSVRAFCFGRQSVMSVVCLSRVRSRKLREIRAQFRHLHKKSGSERKNMT